MIPADDDAARAVAADLRAMGLGHKSIADRMRGLGWPSATRDDVRRLLGRDRLRDTDPDEPSEPGRAAPATSTPTREETP